MKGMGGGRFGPLPPVVQTLDSSMHGINHGKQLRYPLDRNLSGG